MGGTSLRNEGRVLGEISRATKRWFCGSVFAPIAGALSVPPKVG